MLRSSFKGLSSFLKNKLVTHCEASSPDLIEQADASLEGEKPVIKTPQGFDNLKNTLHGASVNSYDGFRVAVQKQVNLNTVVTHFYWLGSQATGQPIYQYRIILPSDDGRMVNVATDAEFNSVEGEIKLPIQSNVTAKTSFVLTGEKNQFSADVEISDESSTTQIEYSNGDDQTVTASLMQCITPELTLGGSGTYSLTNKTLSTAFGGILQWQDNLFAGQWDDKLRLLYTKKVNPNRVHLNTDLLVDADGNSKVSVSGDYYLKQSKVSMSLDSTATLKTLVETSIAPGVQLQLGAEIAHLQGAYRFGYGIMMG